MLSYEVAKVVNIAETTKYEACFLLPSHVFLIYLV